MLGHLLYYMIFANFFVFVGYFMLALLPHFISGYDLDILFFISALFWDIFFCYTVSKVSRFSEVCYGV